MNENFMKEKPVFPLLMSMALPSLLTSALNAILSMYSATYVMILGVYYKLQTFLYMPANGIIQGMRPIIGYNYGAGEHARVKKIFTITLTLNAGTMLVGTFVCLLIRESLIGMFTENVSTINAGGTALRIICAGFVVSAVSVTASGALEGWGKGTAVPAHIPAQICGCHNPSCMDTFKALWFRTCWCVECVLGSRAYNGCVRGVYIQRGCEGTARLSYKLGYCPSNI